MARHRRTRWGLRAWLTHAIGSVKRIARYMRPVCDLARMMAASKVAIMRGEADPRMSHWCGMCPAGYVGQLEAEWHRGMITSNDLAYHVDLVAIHHAWLARPTGTPGVRLTKDAR